jgi:hypothetical protein
MSAKHRRKPYLPDSDLGKKAWMERFITQLESDPERYGFDDPRMFEYYQRTIRNFIKAFDAVSNPGTKSPQATLVKNQARKAAVKLCRDFAMQFKWDASLKAEEKSALGIHFREAPPEVAKLPQGVLTGSLGYPVLAVQSSPNGGHVIRYRDFTTPSKAKPKGVSHLLLFAAIGAKPRMRRTHARLMGAYTRRPFEIMFPMSCGLEGLYVTYYGRWLTTRGAMSPWSPGVSRIIGETQLSLHECGFAHLFEKEGFIDALPGVPGLPESATHDFAQIEADPRVRPLLEGAARGASGAGLFAAMESKMDAKSLPWQAFAMLETRFARASGGAAEKLDSADVPQLENGSGERIEAA